MTAHPVDVESLPALASPVMSAGGPSAREKMRASTTGESDHSSYNCGRMRSANVSIVARVLACDWVDISSTTCDNPSS